MWNERIGGAWVAQPHGLGAEGTRSTPAHLAFQLVRGSWERLLVASRPSPLGWATLIAILLASVLARPCVAFEIPPDIGPELMEARKAWRKAEDLTGDIRDEKNREPKELDALIDARDDAYQHAVEMFEKALKKDPTHPQALAEFGRYWLSRRDFFIARRYLENAWRSALPLSVQAPASANASPDGCGSRAEKSLTEADKADVLRALGGIAERAGETGVALSHYRAALKRYPTDPRNRASLAIGLCAAGNPAEAVTLLEPWDRSDATKVEAPLDFPKDRADVLALGLYTLALAKEELGWNEDALALYRRSEAACKQAFAATGETAESARMAIARLEDRLDEFTENEKSCAKQAEEIARINVERKKANLAPLSAPKSDRVMFADALNFCVHAVSLKKQAMRDRDFLAAISKLRFNEIKAKELESVPEFGLYQSAENSFQASVTSFSRFSRSYYELALCELQMHRFTTARNMLDAAALYNPNDVATLSLRGSVLLDLGQWEEAAGVFRKIVSLDGDNGAAHFGLGRALTALKSNEAVCSEAVDSFGRALRLGVRDERMELSVSLTAKDGQVYSGHIVENGDDWIVKEDGVAPFRIAKKEVEKVNEGPGLRQQALAMLERYQRGEKPVVVQRYSGRKHFDDEPVIDARPTGTIFGQ